MCSCPLAALVDAARRMLDLRGYPAWEERDAAWALERDARLAPLLPRACPTAAAHPVAFVVPSEGLLVWLTDAPRIGMPHLRHLCDRDALAARFGARAALVLTEQPVTTQTQNTLPAHVTVLPWTAVLARPLDHEIVPPHRRATDDDLRAAGLLARAARAHLPALRASDPIVQYLGLRVGDVVRIDRHDGSVYLRLVTAR